MELLAFWVLALFVGIASAIPNLKSRSGDVGTEQVQQLQLFAQYSAAAYCFRNTHDSGKSVSCSAGKGNCSSIESAQTSLIQSFANVGDSSTSGFVAVDDTHKLIVVAIQGTAIASNIFSVVTDMEISREKAYICGPAHNKEDGCLVHGGFWRAMLDVKDIVAHCITSAQVAHPTYKIIVTGHSLGGAVASLMGASLRNDGFIVDIYTYGQPHIGALDIVHLIESQAPIQGSNYRVTHGVDIVPRLPFHAYGKWGNFYPEYYIPRDDAINGIWEVQKIEGGQPYGNEGSTPLWRLAWQIYKSIAAHRNYFGPISSCSTTFLAPVLS